MHTHFELDYICMCTSHVIILKLSAVFIVALYPTVGLVNINLVFIKLPTTFLHYSGKAYGGLCSFIIIANYYRNFKNCNEHTVY